MGLYEPPDDPMEGWNIDELDDLHMEESEDEMCDLDDHKEVISAQEWGGGSALGVGAEVGTSEVLIVCKKCHKARPADRVDSGRGGSGIF